MSNQIAYGFLNIQDAFAEQIDDANVQQVSDAITASVAEHERQLATLTALFAEPTTEYKVNFRTPTVARLQPLDANGRAIPVKPSGMYEVAFPIHEAGIAWGANYKTRVKMTVADANAATAMLVGADRRWIRDHILAALFYDGAGSAGWTFTDPEHGALEIMGLADGDTTKYLIQAGTDNGATDDHYLAQAASIADNANPFPTIYAELTEHPENSGEVVVMIPTNLKASVIALTNFYPIADPNIREGTATSTLAGNLGVATPGTVIGYVDGCWIVEWRTLPDNYMIATMTGGTRALRMRQEPEAQLQGFKMVAQRDNHPFYESQWLRMAGFGAWNRVGALVYRIGSASYAVPTNYSSPMW